MTTNIVVFARWRVLKTNTPRSDGLTNLEEYCRGTNLNVPDTDGDGLDDGPEFAIWGDSCLDSDEDVLANLIDPDSDGDGMTDGWEITYDLDPLTNDSALDADNDDLSNLDEFLQGTDPTDPLSPQIVSVPAIGAIGRLASTVSLLLLGTLLIHNRRK